MRQFFALVAVLVLVAPSVYAEDTPAAKATRKKLEKKVSLDFKNDRLRDVVADLKEEIRGLRITIDTKGGVSQNQRITYECKDLPLGKALEQMLKKFGLKMTIISNKANAYDGFIKIQRK